MNALQSNHLRPHYRWHLAGVLVATSGISLVALDNTNEGSDCTPEYGCLDDYAPGILAAFISGLANAAKMVLANTLFVDLPNRTTAKVRVAEVSTWNCLVPSLLLWIPLLATNEQQQYLDVLGPISSSDRHTLFVLLCVGLALGKMVDRLTKYGMVRLKGALFASMVDAIKKVLTAIVSIFALGEAWSWSRGVSLALVFVAMGLYSYGSYIKVNATKAAAIQRKIQELEAEDEESDFMTDNPGAVQFPVQLPTPLGRTLVPLTTAAGVVAPSPIQRRWSFGDIQTPSLHTPDMLALVSQRFTAQRAGGKTPRGMHGEQSHGQPLRRRATPIASRTNTNSPKLSGTYPDSARSTPRGSVCSAGTLTQGSPLRLGVRSRPRTARTSGIGLWCDGLGEFTLAANNDSDDPDSEDEALAAIAAHGSAVKAVEPHSPLLPARAQHCERTGVCTMNDHDLCTVSTGTGAVSPGMVSLRLDFTQCVESAANRFVASSSHASVLSESTRQSSTASS